MAEAFQYVLKGLLQQLQQLYEKADSPSGFEVLLLVDNSGSMRWKEVRQADVNELLCYSFNSFWVISCMQLVACAKLGGSCKTDLWDHAQHRELVFLISDMSCYNSVL